MRDPSLDILFEPLQIGPVTAKNRFYQVPHCTGMGWRRPNALAVLRETKAEGGWAVVCTEGCSMHPTSDDDYFPHASLWNEEDIRAQRLMTEKVHQHQSLAGVELWIGGGSTANLGTRIPGLALQDRPFTNNSIACSSQPRRMDREDMRNIRKWHREAAIRAVQAEFDIVYVYATHGYLLSQFLSSETNERTDEYGGTLENRVRFIRELIEETGEALAGKAAVATRFSVDIKDAETYDAFSMLAELPDLWDLTVPDYGVEMGVSRFVKEGALLESIGKAKTLTSKPVVAVGRFTSPDVMARAIKSGTQDMIGAARPSIADPFLPKKIEEGRLEDIRECIGCNICYAHNSLGVPIRCTQNPTMGEEWRHGWHPEKIQKSSRKETFLVVGAGPAGLEASRVLGAQGHKVMLVDAERQLGGRVTRESKLPGLSEWARVRDWRLGQIEKMPSVETYPESRLEKEDIAELELDHVLIATGCKWASDGVGIHSDTSFLCTDAAMVINAETVINGDAITPQHVMIYDDDHYYMGSVLALELVKKGHDVTLVTPAGRAGDWGSLTEEIYTSNAALIEAGVKIVTNKKVTSVETQKITVACVFSEQQTEINCDAIIPLCRRIPVLGLYDALVGDPVFVQEQNITSIRRIGDAEAPSIIAAAVHSGYRHAMEIGLDISLDFSKREHPVLMG